MKKSFLLIPALAAFTLLSCGGGSSNQDGNDTKTTYQYVEPQDSIVKIIWNKLQTDDPKVANTMSLAKKFNYMPQSKAETFNSKTNMEYFYQIPNEDCHDNPLSAKYRIQCYQKLDESWIAFVDESVYGEDIENEDCSSRYYVVQLKDGNLIFAKNSDYFPESFQIAEAHVGAKRVDNIGFSNTGLCYYSEYCWPLIYSWNGNTFNFDSKIILNSVNTYDGRLIISDVEGDYKSVSLCEVAKDYPDGVVKDSKGKILAKLDIKDGKIEGYTVVDSTCGVVQYTDYKQGISNAGSVCCVDHDPIALGFPIKNVLNYKKDKRLKDTATTQATVDGKFVVTQYIHREERGNDSRDVFIEYTAKDQNSPIESIRVYIKRFTIALIDKVNEADKLSPVAKEIFKALNFNENDPEYGGLIYASFYDENGFDIITENKALRFQIYKTNDGRYLVVLSDTNSERTYGVKYWYYQNGVLSPTEFQIPKPDYDKEDIRYDFKDNTIECYYNWGCDEESEYESFEFFSASWNGENFVKDE